MAVPYFGRGFAADWKGDEPQVDDALARQAAAASFGVALIQPVDIYVQTERAVKYAVLFIVMTFVLAFAWEITGGVLVHPIQYLFVGFTMCVFYLLLLSLAEHRGFDFAYAAAAAATVLLLSWYGAGFLADGAGGPHGRCDGDTLRLLVFAATARGLCAAGWLGRPLCHARAADVPLTRRVNWYELKLGEAVRRA